MRRSGLFLVILLCSYIEASAATLNCIDNDYGLSAGDMTYNGAVANDCYGVVIGNDKNSPVSVLPWGSDWSYADSTDDESATSFSGIEFSIEESGASSGTWVLTGTDTNGDAPLNIPTYLDFIAVLKGSNRFAAYYFDDKLFDGLDGGTWKVTFTNNGGRIPDLSHMSIYVREGSAPAVPEPTAILLLGSGLVAFGFAKVLVRRHKSR